RPRHQGVSMRSSSKRLRGVVWLSVAGGALVLISPATATRASQPPAQQQVAPATAAAAIPPHIRQIRQELSGMLVSIDPATGEFRTPTPDEQASLAGSAGASARSVAPQPVDLPGGGAALLSTAANMDFTTAVQGPDGTLTFRCTHGFD